MEPKRLISVRSEVQFPPGPLRKFKNLSDSRVAEVFVCVMAAPVSV